MYPPLHTQILIKGAHANYVPWQTQDLKGLVSGLPDLHEAAHKWILDFQEKILGHLLALESLATQSKWAKDCGRCPDMSWLGISSCDGMEFNPYRNRLWHATGEAYPQKLDILQLYNCAINCIFCIFTVYYILFYD